ncbi:hypothetical protein PMAYCL1PPCAC_27135, partial [Pristionchus mayeri]
GTVTSLLLMSIERLTASRNLSTYESSSRKNGMKCMVIHLSLTFIGVFISLLDYDFPTRVPHCTTVSVEGRTPATIMAVIQYIYFC